MSTMRTPASGPVGIRVGARPPRLAALRLFDGFLIRRPGGSCLARPGPAGQAGRTVVEWTATGMEARGVRQGEDGSHANGAMGILRPGGGVARRHASGGAAAA